MPLKFADSGSSFQSAPAGNHVARCVKVVDLGTQKGEYKGETIIRRQVLIGWELPLELMREGPSAGKPFLVRKIYTASLGDKATLRKDLEMWRGKAFTSDELKGFEAKAVLGKPCMVSVIQNEKGSAKVGGITAVPKGMEVPGQMNQSSYFSLEPDEFNMSAYDVLGKWDKETIALSPEFIEHTKGKDATQQIVDMDDDIEF